uniref:Uncharacterized protein n=1 Tax=Timema poppense TaxID=170557 RepID=A0A7R9H4I0_TIMPO|nr:unnamed protein product [Timema poppensis]
MRTNADTVMPNPAGISLPGHSQGQNSEKKRKRERPFSPILNDQEGVRPQSRFLIMSRAGKDKNLKRVIPFILERVKCFYK